jgi:RimJ/RimL family protein N-acetyltransferase
MNLQENIQRIKEMMGLINEKFNEGLQVMLIETFDKRILNTGGSGGYFIRYSVDGEEVGAIEGNNWKNYLVVGHIYLTPEYRGKGHSVEFL